MPEDEELALRLQQGDSDALSILVQRHHSPLIGFLYRMTGGDRILAEDMAQETFFRVIRSIHQYRYPRSLKPWVYAIATNIARDYFKRASNRLSVELDAEAEQVEDIQYPEDALLEADEQQRVAAAVRSLPLHQRTAIILRYYQGLSLAEIAETLQIPVGTVKSRLSLGLRTLKTILERE